MRPLSRLDAKRSRDHSPVSIYIDEAFVVPFDQLALDVLHRLQGNPHHDQTGTFRRFEPYREDPPESREEDRQNRTAARNKAPVKVIRLITLVR